MELLTYSEAAELTGLANKTLQRHVKKGILAVVETPVGKRIPREALEPYLFLRKDTQGQEPGFPEEDSEELSETPEDPSEGQAGTGEPRWDPREGQARTGEPRQEQGWASESPAVPLSAHLAALDLARSQLESLQRIVEEAHRQLEDSHRLALSAERAKLSLEVQLGQYQRVLAEQAESLVELRAEKLAAEMHLKQLAGTETEVPVAELPLKIATPRPTFGQRVRSWFGFSRAQNS